MIASPKTFDEFVDHSFVKLVRTIPETATSLGIDDHPDLEICRRGFADYSPEGTDARIGTIVEAHRDLLQRARHGLAPADALTAEVYRYFLEYPCFDGLVGVQGKRFAYHDFHVNPQAGVQTEFINRLVHGCAVRDAADAVIYLERLAQLSVAIRGAIEGLRFRQSRGIVLPEFLLSEVIDEQRQFLDCPVEENQLLSSFAANCQAARLSTDLVVECTDILTTSVYPAYAELLAVLEGQRGSAPSEGGAWQLPDGDAYYAYRLRRETTTELTADEIHDVGIAESGKLRDELTRELAKLGYGGPSFAAQFSAMAADERFHYPQDELGRELMLADFGACLDTIKPLVQEAFVEFPRAELVIEPTPRYLEKTRTTNYTPAARDGSRPAIFELNVGMSLANPSWEVPTLAYHEAIPGHHFQISIAQEQQRLGLFRRSVIFPAYIEAWAKYTERLPCELGWNRDPHWAVARKRRELISTVNLVLDTGIHRKRWTRERAIRSCMENAGTDETMARYLVHRICAQPGQVCAYKIGLMRFLDLRARFERSLGASFDLRRFHHAVLRRGALPLDVLDKVVLEEMRQR